MTGYVPIGWNELPASDFAATPLSAENFNHMDLGIKRTHAEVLTTTERDALTGADLFTGRIIFNRTGERFEIYISTPPTSGAAFSTAGWFRLPTFFDVVPSTGDSTINGVKTFISPIEGQPRFIGARAYRTTDVTMPGGTFTIVNWFNEEFDTQNMHPATPATHLARLVAQKVGYYRVDAIVRWGDSLNGPYDMRLMLNGNTVIAESVTHPRSSPSAEHSQSISRTIHLSVGNFVEVFLRPRGANSDIIGGIGLSYFEMQLIGG